MANEIDILMDLDPLQLTKDGPEIEAIIAYYRNTRVKEDASGKKVRAKPEKSSAPIDLAALGLGGAKAEPGPKPGSGLRRV